MTAPPMPILGVVSSSTYGDSIEKKRWTIMAALLGTNMAFALFQGIAQEANYIYLRNIGLIILVSAIPFQGIYFLIQTYLHEFNERLNSHALVILKRLSVFCQIVSYLSITGIAVFFYTYHWVIGATFTLSGLIAVVMVRLAMSQVSECILQNNPKNI